MSDYEQVKKIFNKAVKFPKSRVGGYLDRVCGDDAALRAEVEKLIENHLRNAATRQGDGDSTPIAGEYRAGDTIDKFTIRKVLGEGGMGIVYLAEQAKPIKRQVAVKVLKPGTDTKATLNRFDAERQALAIMDHPGIAKVLDAGATKEGRPWFAMEYIEGEDLTFYCDGHQMALRDRLVLFASICDAIQHAHVKGIVHRDLKPGNILIARDENGMPQAKIIDFGIAKAMSATLTDVTHHTSIGTLVGTIKYMSPEQVGGEFDIDTRTDVYALGVILYELICGHSPFEWKTLQSLGENEIRRVIRDKIPPNPTTRLSALDPGELKSIAQKREVLPAQLVRTLRRELEWIPLKALRKARDDRYPSAEAFAADVRNYLNGHPLVPAPVTRFYRARKFLMRNKFGTGVAASFLLLLIVALLVVLVALDKARDNLQLANEKTTEAEVENSRVVDLKEFMLDIVHPDEFELELDSRVNLDKDETGYLDPQISSDLLKELADLKSEAGNYTKAIELRDKIGDKVLREKPPRKRGDHYYRLGLDHLEVGNYDKARIHLHTAESTQKESLGQDDRDSLRTKAALARTNAALARLGHEEGFFEQAHTRFQETIARQQEIVDLQELDDAVSKQIELDLWEARYRRGLLYLDMGHFHDAKDDFDTVKFKLKSQGHYGLALLAIAQSDPKTANDHLDNARLKENTSQQELRIYSVEGILAMQLDMEYRTAERILKRVLNKQRDNPNIGLEHPDAMRTSCLLIELILQEHSVADLQREDNPHIEKAKDLLMDITRTDGRGPVERRRKLIRSELDLIEGNEDLVRTNLQPFIERGDATGSLLYLRALCNLGLAMARLDENDVNAELYLKTANGRLDEALHDRHPDVIRSRIYFAEVLFHAKKHDEAHQELNEVAEYLRQHDGTYIYRRGHADMAAVYERISKKLREKETTKKLREKETEELQEERLKCLKALQEIDHRNNDAIRSEIQALEAQLGGGSGQPPAAP